MISQLSGEAFDVSFRQLKRHCASWHYLAYFIEVNVVCVLEVHAYIISALKQEMPAIFGKKDRKRQLIKNLGDIFAQIQDEHQISPGDFPNLKKMQDQLRHHDFSTFHGLKPKLLETVDQMLAEDVARLMQLMPKDEEVCREVPVVKGGAFNGFLESPFGYGMGEGIDEGRGELEWVVFKNRDRYEEIFRGLSPVNGKVSGAAARSELMKSKLPSVMLAKIWKMADVDQDGMLDVDEFGLALHLINVKLGGHDLPVDLPDHLVPPSKREFTFAIPNEYKSYSISMDKVFDTYRYSLYAK